jgi:hypothetical protein
MPVEFLSHDGTIVVVGSADPVDKFRALTTAASGVIRHLTRTGALCLHFVADFLICLRAFLTASSEDKTFHETPKFHQLQHAVTIVLECRLFGHFSEQSLERAHKEYSALLERFNTNGKLSAAAVAGAMQVFQQRCFPGAQMKAVQRMCATCHMPLSRSVPNHCCCLDKGGPYKRAAVVRTSGSFGNFDLGEV